MGKLIKNHWARLIILVASAYQVAAAIEGFFWPKIFWDQMTTNLNGIVAPVPILQIINLLFGIFGLCLEWPLPIFTAAADAVTRFNEATTKASTKEGSDPPQPLSWWIRTLGGMHGSIEARLFIFPLSSLVALLLYQGTNAGLYYLIGMGVYFWAFSEGEVIMGTPWTLPKKPSRMRQDHSIKV